MRHTGPAQNTKSNALGVRANRPEGQAGAYLVELPSHAEVREQLIENALAAAKQQDHHGPAHDLRNSMTPSALEQ